VSKRRVLRALELLLLLGGAAGLVVVAYSWIETRRAEREAREAFERAAALPPFEDPRAREGQAPGGLGRPRAGSVLGLLEIPRLDMEVAVLRGTLDGQLEQGAGTIEGTRLEHNLGIAAHRDAFFRPLRHVAPGDLVRLRTFRGVIEYAVTAISIVGPERVDVLDPTPRRALTLVTCYPFFHVGHAPKRFVVRAEQIQAAAGRAPL
jgi:sortase A